MNYYSISLQLTIYLCSLGNNVLSGIWHVFEDGLKSLYTSFNNKYVAVNAIYHVVARCCYQSERFWKLGHHFAAQLYIHIWIQVSKRRSKIINNSSTTDLQHYRAPKGSKAAGCEGCAGAAPGWLTAAGKGPGITPPAMGIPCCWREEGEARWRGSFGTQCRNDMFFQTLTIQSGPFLYTVPQG